MTLGQAIAYFFAEAFLSLRRGWRVSLLAVLTIAISLFLAGLFALVGHNLRTQVAAWQGEARVVVYFSPAVSPEALEAARSRVEALPWVASVAVVTLEDARGRFEKAFPDLVDVLDDPDAEPLPPSLELRLATPAEAEPLTASRREELTSVEGSEWVDDDRAWLGRLESLVGMSRAAGWGLGGLLLVAAVFTISSVIRLTAYRYRDEIAVMRQVGATEFLIRCPFYLEGFFQGLAGGGVAILGLWWIHRAFGSSAGAFSEAFLGGFLPLSSSLVFLLLGAVAGTIGAVLSLRREFVEETVLD